MFVQGIRALDTLPNRIYYELLVGLVELYGTYEISILGRILINYVTSTILCNGFIASLLHISYIANFFNTYISLKTYGEG